MSEASDTRRAFRWSWLRHAVQAAALVLFAAPVLAAGWSLFGTSVGGDDAAATPAQLPFFGSLSSSSIGGLDILDPFGALQVIAASKTFELDWLLAALPVLIVYGLIRGRAFCGWVCPVNLLLEIVDFARRKLRIDVREMPVPRHAKLWIALAVLGLSALTGVPVFEAFSPISAVNKGILRCRDRRLGAAGHRADGTVLGLSRVVPLAVPAGRLLRGAWPIRPGKREDRSRSLHSLRRVQACMPVRSRDPRASARRMRRDRAGRRLHGLRFVHRRLPHARPVVHPGTRLQAGRHERRGMTRCGLWCIARLRDAPEAAPFARAAFPFTRSAACA